MLGAVPIVFPTVFAALYAAHEVGDHWLQTHGQACGKGARSWSGRLLCARHVATLTAVKVAAVTLAAVVLGLPVNPYTVAAALGADALSHYWADRRFTLHRLAVLVGKGEFAELGDGAAAPVGTGAYALDQSWHIGWLFAASLLASLGAS